VTFRYFPLCFRFVALTPVSFGSGLPGNAIRSALGSSLRQAGCVPDCDDSGACRHGNDCPYLYLFQPNVESGPSGLRHRPRPFVIRARQLEHCSIARGDKFEFQINVFELRRPVIDWVVRAFCRWEEHEQGPARSTVHLDAVELQPCFGPPQLLFADGVLLRPTPEPVSLSLERESPQDAKRLHVEFLSPTELKENGIVVEVPRFATLMRRIWERINTLSSVYGDGVLPINWSSLIERAASVRNVSSRGVHVPVKRTSRKVGRHPLGGFVGELVYEGEVSQFVPWLRIAEITGVGRQTVWGKGEIRVRVE